MSDNSIVRRTAALFGFILALVVWISSPVFAQHEMTESQQAHEIQHEDEVAEEYFNVGEMIIEHITDAYEWHIITLGKTHVTVPLPVILYDKGQWHVFSSSHFHHGEYMGYSILEDGAMKGKIVRKDLSGTEVRPDLDISFTKNVLAIFMSLIILVVVFISVANLYKKNKGHAPKGLQSFLEPIIIFIRDDIAKASIGEKKYEKYLPFLLTIFFFILINNLMGIIPFFPGGANVTGNIAVTGVLAVFTFIITTFSGNKNYWTHIINAPGVPWWLKIPVPLMPVVELMGIFTKPFVLMVRLFANIIAGHIIILGFISLIFIFGEMSTGLGYGVSIVSVGFSIFMDFLELLVAFIQAYVFTLLSALYFGMATEEAHH
jgi:F-type H+-transporting ATPase subunit a